MYNGKKVKELLDASHRKNCDLAEFLYGDRERSLTSIISEAANPTAKIIEKMAIFLNVSIEEFFEREDGFESEKSNEQLTLQVWRAKMKAKDVEIDAQKEQIETYKKLIASQERELALMHERAQKGRSKKNVGEVRQ